MDVLELDYERLLQEYRKAKERLRKLKEQIKRHPFHVRNYFTCLEDSGKFCFEQLAEQVEWIKEIQGNILENSKNPMTFNGVHFSIAGQEYIYRDASSWCYDFNDFGPPSVDPDDEGASLYAQFPELPETEDLHRKSAKEVSEIFDEVIRKYNVSVAVALFCSYNIEYGWAEI